MISQQFNVILAALAGAERIFEVIDEKPEADDGYVQLVFAEEGPNGEIVECDHHTGKWAWKHPHGDGTLTYTWLRGEDVYKRQEKRQGVRGGVKEGVLFRSLADSR